MIIMKIFSDNRTDNSDFVTAAELLGEIGRDNGKYDPVVMNYLENAYLKSEGLQKPIIAGLLGYQALYSKDYKTAICYFNIASGEEGLIGRARVDIELGNYPDAIQEYLNYFSLCRAGERFERVRDAFIRQSLYYAGALKKAKDYKQAVQYYLNVVNTFPSDAAAGEGLLKVAGIYSITGGYQKSSDCLDKVLNSRFTNCFEEAVYDKAVLYYQWGKKNLSIKYFKELQEKYPSGIFGSKAQDWIILIKKDIES
jgi:tetratricopeptide (TPR) repeat protein